MPLDSARKSSVRDLDPARFLHHKAFLDLLVRLGRRSARWRRTHAGHRVLHLLDQIWTLAPNDGGLWGQRVPIRFAIAKVRQPKATREALDGLLHLAAPGVGAFPEALDALMRYGTRLEQEGEFRLAADVHAMVIHHASRIRYVDVVPDAHERLGRCTAESGHARSALTSYDEGLAVAARHRNQPARIRIAIAKANLFRTRGVPTRAREALEDASRQARVLADADMLARVWREQGAVFRALGDRREALRHFAKAFQQCTDPRHLEGLLNEIALTLEQSGRLTEAHETWLVSHRVTTRDRVARCVAGINLMRLAYLQGDQFEFDRYRRALERSRKPGRLRVTYWLAVGDGWMVFDRRDHARTAYRKAVARATGFGYARERAEAKRALKDGASIARSLPHTVPEPLAPRVRLVLERIRALTPLPPPPRIRLSIHDDDARRWFSR